MAMCWPFQDFNLTTAEGEFVVLVGPSGCGKTTTMRMIAGLETVTGGEIKNRREERRRNDPAGARRRHGLPELCFVSAHERVCNMSLVCGAEVSERTSAERVHSAAKILGINTCLNETQGAIRGRAPAGCAGPCDCQRAKGLFDGRAAVQYRRQAPGGNASRDHQAATPPWSHHFLCHA